MQIAQAKASGDDTSDLESKLAEEQTKLTNNIKTDKAAAGQDSKGVAGSAAAAASTDTATAAAASATSTKDAKKAAKADKQEKAAKTDVPATVKTPAMEALEARIAEQGQKVRELKAKPKSAEVDAEIKAEVETLKGLKGELETLQKAAPTI